jgi:hypothetical protein
MKKTLAPIGNLLALVLYGMGILAPLTPSEGMPSFWELLLFVGIPMVLLLYSWHICSSKVAKISVAFQATVIAGFTMWLLLLELGALANGS